MRLLSLNKFILIKTPKGEIINWGYLFFQTGYNYVHHPCLSTVFHNQEIIQIIVGYNQDYYALTEKNNLLALRSSLTSQQDPNRLQPIFISSLQDKKIKHIAATEKGLYILTTSGKVYSTGVQGPWLGIRQSPLQMPFACPLDFLGQKIMKICAGRNHVVALTDQGKVFGWGKNDQGQLGLGENESIDIPRKIYPAECIDDIAVGNDFTVLLIKGEVYTSGNNCAGQLGSGDTEDSYAFQKVIGLANITLITADEESFYAMSALGNLYMCGGSSCDNTVPKLVKPYEYNKEYFNRHKVVYVIAGRMNALILDEQGLVYVKGDKVSEELFNVNYPERNMPTELKEDSKANILKKCIQAEYVEWSAERKKKSTSEQLQTNLKSNLASDNYTDLDVHAENSPSLRL